VIAASRDAPHPWSPAALQNSASAPFLLMNCAA